ncbi:MAG: AAA domain-containing protein, partial [bacterium]
MHDLLNEQVHGYWPDLATALCKPDCLQTPSMMQAPSFFFCDNDPHRPSLNEQQRAAVIGALSTPHVFCVQGPPGTGKTTVICELVQQLIARGERVLLAAPTHVAVDEVLRRIGSAEGVRPLRLSWDDAKVAEDVRKFTPSQVIDPFVERATSHDDRKASRWQQERDRLGEAIDLLRRLQDRQKVLISAQRDAAHATDLANAARCRQASETPVVKDRLKRVSDEIDDLMQASSAWEEKLCRMDAELETVTKQTRWTRRLLSRVGIGELAHLRRQRRTLAARHETTTSELTRLRNEAKDLAKQLERLERDVATAGATGVEARRAFAQASENVAEAEADCRENPALRHEDLTSEVLSTTLEALGGRYDRLGEYERLHERFDELVSEVTNGCQDPGALRRDLLAVTNLFCCTTSGIASSPVLRDVTVDTLIIDEASRVTDPEFLIGAVRARRWILVGDEQQLPPYVEQNDEHFIHALSALHHAEQEQVELTAAVDRLGDLWEEDEELHRFRRESVAAVAERLLDNGDWDEAYREAFRVGIQYLPDDDTPPSRALLGSMRNSLVRSLFEQIVESCPQELRVRLAEQRRMIAPIADIVSEPVYGGDYRTPNMAELAAIGVEPLTTPTFPTPVTFLDTSALRMQAREKLRNKSFVNPTEARWVVQAPRPPGGSWRGM